MAGSLVLPVVSAVAGKAGDALVESVTRMWGVDDDRRKLERHLLAVQCKLLDAEEKSETNPAIKRWMKDLRAVAYEADDVLDDFQYEALRREAQIGESTTRKVLSYFTRHSPLLFRFTVSRNLNNVLKKINDLVLEMNMFALVNHAEAPQVLYRQTHSAVDECSDIFGRDDDKEVVVKLLLDQQYQQKPHVLPIIGMGGLGKTTLAKMVYNDHRVQNHFQLKMWHCVSDNFDACPVVRSIIELVTKERCDLRDTIELLRGQLQEANLHQKQNLSELLLFWGHDRSECRPRDVVADKEEALEFPLPPSRLKSLKVCGNGHIEISSWMKDPHIFLCLKELSMCDCWRCKDLPPLWQSLSLESLSLSRLDNLATISSGIGMVVQGCNGSLTIFPKLKNMSLQQLPNLEKWIDNERSESITSVMFPELKVLRIDNCPKLVNIPKAPILQELDINHCKIAVNSVSHLTELSQLRYFGGGCDSMDVQVIPFSSWPSLVELYLGWLGNLILPEEQQSMAPLESIRKLWIAYSNGFLSPNLSKWSFGFWECFAFVEELVIAGCDDLVHWPVKEFCSLNCLRDLKVSYCENLIGSSSVESLLSPQLKALTISFCNRLSDIPKLPESLERLSIQHCACLISLPSNVASLARLMNLRLLGCEGLRKLPDGMDGLTALQELWIRQCPGIETLPQDFLQRLPTLRKLMTLGSPKLERRCRRGGEYWGFVSNIPYLNRDVVEERSTKGFAKRFPQLRW